MSHDNRRALGFLNTAIEHTQANADVLKAARAIMGIGLEHWSTRRAPKQLMLAAAVLKPVTAAELTNALAGAGYGAQEVAVAVKTYFNGLSALELGRLLQEAYRTPPMATDAMQAALKAATFNDAQVAAALSTLYPPKINFKREGPAGVTSALKFDDFELAAQQAKSITKIIVHSGEIVDGLNSLIGEQMTPQHGGTAGSATEIAFAPGDALVEVSGSVGQWCGANCVLQIILKTSKNKVYGPFGSMRNVIDRTSFTFNAQAGEIAGFHGSSVRIGQGTYLGSLGVVILDRS